MGRIVFGEQELCRNASDVSTAIERQPSLALLCLDYETMQHIGVMSGIHHIGVSPMLGCIIGTDSR